MAALDFYQAPASKAVFYGAGLATLASSFFFKAPWPGYDVTAFSGMRLHRLLASQLVFGSVGEMVLGLGLTYQFRIFERRMGTSRFLSFSLLSTLVSLSLQMVALAVDPGLGNQTLNRMAPGPYSLIFAFFVHYFAFVPKLHRQRILGAEFSEKTLVYFLGSQLLFSRGKESLVTGACGFLAGLLCLTDKLPLSRLQLPESLRSFGKSYLEPLISTESAASIAARQRREQLSRMGRMAQALQAQGVVPNDAQNGYQVDRLVPGPGAFFGGLGGVPPHPQQQHQPAAPQVAAVHVSEEHVATLTAMGFERPRAEAALRAFGNDVQRAAESLLSS